MSGFYQTTEKTKFRELTFLLTKFLPIKRTLKLKKAAVDIVQGLTGSEDGVLAIAGHSDIVLPSLPKLLDEKKEISEPAAEALINMSLNMVLAEKMVSVGMIKIAMEVLYKQDSNISKLLVMLLVNLTQIDAGSSALLQIGDGKMQGLYLSKLVRSFSRSSTEGKVAFYLSERKRKILAYIFLILTVGCTVCPYFNISFLCCMETEDPFEHVASILINISKIEEGRKILLDPKRSLLKQIIPQFDSTKQLRKRGVSGTIRNCCFEAEGQLQNLLLISKFLWLAILLPVADKKVYGKEDTSKMPLELANPLSHEREAADDPEIRVQVLESVYMISLQEAGRRALWSVNGPRILQVGYEEEDDPKVMEAYERIGSLLVNVDDAEGSSAQGPN